MPTETRKPHWELRARSGRAVLVSVGGATRHELDPGRLPVPESLVTALHKWARDVAGAIASPPGLDDPLFLASRDGHQLALRLAVETGGEISYLDPLTGTRSRVGAQRQESPPTPWVTGLTISGIIAAFTAVTFVVITVGLAQINTPAAVLVNLAVAAGFAPSIRLGVRALVWRWVAYGAAAGIVLSWIALLLDLLG
jgi:hypothetical protein